MALGTWWIGDPLPDLSPLPFFTVRQSSDQQFIASVTDLSSEEIALRWSSGNIFYRAFLAEVPVACGWSGSLRGGIEEVDLAFKLSPGDRYLWDFQTFPQWRNRGVYQHFLQEIIRQEKDLFRHFWLLYKPGNEIAAHAIRKAGFIFVGELVLTNGHATALELFDEGVKAMAGAALLGLPVLDG